MGRAMGSAKRDGGPIRIGISSCLLGQKVRYDGGHQRDAVITDLFGRHFAWVPVCPEVESGMGVPREPVRLEGDPDRPNLVGVKTGADHTRKMERFSRARVKALQALGLSGYILKARSPSCGMARVKLYGEGGTFAGRKATGIFARRLLTAMPHLPVEEEGRLRDPGIRENFITRVFCYHRWRSLVGGRFTRGRLVAFHTAHKFLLRAHSVERLRRLGRLVADAKRFTPARLADRYEALFFETLSRRATTKRHADVLTHMAGFFKQQLSKEEKAELAGLIEDFRQGLIPLVVPVTLLKHYVLKFQNAALAGQIYLNPHPKELMLRNHV
jgi:uncharacterized protein YbgA (DUF1722 family)/uncharacterized protein YbbK (DUF523 family)